LLLTRAGTPCSIFRADVSASGLRAAGSLVARLTRRELLAEGLPSSMFTDLEPERVILAKAADRSILGCMNDMSFLWGTRSPDLAASRAPASSRSTGRFGATSTAPAVTGLRLS